MASALLLACLLFGNSNPARAQNDSGFKYLDVKVLDSDGKPLADVNVDIRIDGTEFPMPTDEEGLLSFNVPSGRKTRMRLKVSHPGYATLSANWNAGDKLPDEYTIRMQEGTTIGGIIQNEFGEPVEGVNIKGYISSQDSMRGGGVLQPMLSGVIATTDREGRWRFESAPAKKVDILTDFEHPDYVDENILGYRAGNWEQLHTLEHVVVLQQGVVIEGTVLDPDGLPAPEAKVTLSKGRYYSDQQQTQTDQDGKYRIANVKPSAVDVTVLSSDWAPESRKITATPEMKPVDFQLKPGQTVKFRITDQNGKPVEGVKVTPDEWRGLEILPQSKTLTNNDGIWEWELAPADTIQYRLYKKGHMSTSVADVMPREEPYDVTIPPELVFTGKVADADSGKPIEEFQVVEGIYWRESDDDVVWQEHRKAPGTNGHYRVAYNSGYAGFKVKIEAEGYRPQASRLVAVDEGEVIVDFQLETGSGPSGIVKLADGTPAAGAEVLMADDSRTRITVHNGEYERRSDTIVGTTDDHGKFSLPIPADKFSLVCLHEGGWACVLESEASRTDFDLVLEPWATLEGKLLQGDEPVESGMLRLWFPELERDMRTSRVQWTYRAASDEQGQFSIPRIRAGTATIQRNLRFGPRIGRGLGSFSSHATRCDLVAGETTQIQIGGSGVAVAGQIVPPPEYALEVPWNMGRVHLNRWTEQLRPGEQPSAKQLKEIEKAKYQRYAIQPKNDGTFTIHDVAPGKYWLDVVVYQPRADRDYNWAELARLRKIVTITGDDSGQPLDIGEHELPIKTDDAKTDSTDKLRS